MEKALLEAKIDLNFLISVNSRCCFAAGNQIFIFYCGVNRMKLKFSFRLKEGHGLSVVQFLGLFWLSKMVIYCRLRWKLIGYKSIFINDCGWLLIYNFLLVYNIIGLDFQNGPKIWLKMLELHCRTGPKKNVIIYFDWLNILFCFGLGFSLVTGDVQSEICESTSTL